MPPTQPRTTVPPSPTGPRNLPTPTEPGGETPVTTNLAEANPQPKPLPPQPQPQPQPQQPQQPVVSQQTASPDQTDQLHPTKTDDAPPQNVDVPSKSAQAAKEELRGAIRESNEILTTASTVFWMTLFPDIYTIDRTKVTVSKKSIFGTSDVLSMRIEDILNASVTAGVMFGRLQLTNRIIANDEHPYSIGPFWRSDALRLKRVTQGYVIALQKGIDVSSLSCSELVGMLEQLGEDDHSNSDTSGAMNG